MPDCGFTGGGVAGRSDAEVLSRGQALAGRYRLDQLRAGRDAVGLWAATDVVLARPVLVRVVPVATPSAPNLPAEAAVRAAAARASAVTSPRVARVLDCDVHVEGDRRFCFVVSEWPQAPTLAEVLREEPLTGPEAADLAWQVADALSEAAKAGAGHGRLQPDHVTVDARGNVRIADLELSRVLARADLDPAQLAAADAWAVGAVLYAGLTGHWPTVGTSLPPAPTSRGTRCTPRQLNAAAPRDLDELTERLLAGVGELATPRGAAAALAALPRSRRDFEAAAAAPPRGWALPRWALRLAPPVALVVIAALAYLIGGLVTQAPSPARNVPVFTSPTDAAGGRPRAALPVQSVSVFNPQGGVPDDVAGARLAADGNVHTAWYTFHYYGNPRFGGLKSGVGLLFDLGRPRLVRKVAVLLVYPGASLQLLAGNQAATELAGYQLQAQRKQAPQACYFSVSSGAHRYWLVWLTRLPRVGSYYNEGIAEVTFYG